MNKFISIIGSAILISACSVTEEQNRSIKSVECQALKRDWPAKVADQPVIVYWVNRTTATVIFVGKNGSDTYVSVNCAAIVQEDYNSSEEDSLANSKDAM